MCCRVTGKHHTAAKGIHSATQKLWNKVRCFQQRGQSGGFERSGFARLLAMSVIDEVLEANEIYSRTHELRRLTPRPERKLAVLTCMDTRLSIRTLGLKTGDAHIIRNA